MRLYNYSQFITESNKRKVLIDQLEPGMEVSYRKDNGETQTKRIASINHEKQIVYFTDNKMREFGKSIDDIIYISEEIKASNQLSA